MKRRQAAFLVPALVATAALGGCASMDKGHKQRQVASVLSFLFPGTKDGAPPPASTQVAVIKVPFRIGVAFVPDAAQSEFRLSETERQQLATRVREAFANYPFISHIEAVPSLYLEAGGGFDTGWHRCSTSTWWR